MNIGNNNLDYINSNHGYYIYSTHINIDEDENTKQSGKEFDIQILIDTSISIEKLGKKCKKNNNLLHYAANSQNVHLIERLFDKIKNDCVDIDHLLFEENDDQETPFHLAANNLESEMFIIFIEKTMDDYQQFFLHHWVFDNEKEKIERFLKNCKKDSVRTLFLNIIDINQGTPFAYALYCADGKLANKEWKSSEELARTFLDSFEHSQNRFELITKEGHFLGSEYNLNYLSMACNQGDPQIVDTILGYFNRELSQVEALEALLTLPTIQGFTPLHLGIESKNPGTVEILLKYIGKLPEEAQERIFLAGDDFNHNVLMLPAHSFSEVEEQNLMNTMIKLVFKAIPTKKIKKRALKAQDDDGNNIFHLLADNTVTYPSETFKYSNQLHVNLQQMLGELYHRELFNVNYFADLARDKNNEGKTPLDILADKDLNPN